MTDATAAAHRQVSFGEAPALFFKNYVNFQGRSSRGAFWWWVLAYYVILIVLYAIDFGVLGAGNSGFTPLSSIFSLATILPLIAIVVRRLHDIGKSGWWIFIGLIPIVGWIVLIVFYCKPGVRSENQFGADVEAGR